VLFWRLRKISAISFYRVFELPFFTKRPKTRLKKIEQKHCFKLKQPREGETKIGGGKRTPHVMNPDKYFSGYETPKSGMETNRWGGGGGMK
jgi:hypothetical protein